MSNPEYETKPFDSQEITRYFAEIKFCAEYYDKLHTAAQNLTMAVTDFSEQQAATYIYQRIRLPQPDEIEDHRDMYDRFLTYPAEYLGWYVENMMNLNDTMGWYEQVIHHIQQMATPHDARCIDEGMGSAHIGCESEESSHCPLRVLAGVLCNEVVSPQFDDETYKLAYLVNGPEDRAAIAKMKFNLARRRHLYYGGEPGYQLAQYDAAFDKNFPKTSSAA